MLSTLLKRGSNNSGRAGKKGYLLRTQARPNCAEVSLFKRTGLGVAPGREATEFTRWYMYFKYLGNTVLKPSVDVI